MSDRPVSVGAWFGRGWEAFKAQPGALIGGYVPFIVLNVVLVLVGPRAESIATPAQALQLLLYSALQFALMILILLPLLVGFYALCLRAVRGEQVRATGVFHGFSYFGPAMWTAILYGLIVFCGMLLLIVPGLIWGLRYIMWWFAVADRGLSGRAALRLSGKITKGHKGKLLVVLLMMGAIFVPLMIVFQLAPVVGPILVYVISLSITPLFIATFAAAYESLSSNAEAATAAEVIPEGSDEASDEQPL